MSHIYFLAIFIAMQRIRSHIVRLFTISLLWAALGVYIVQPAQAKHSARSFSNWFASVTQKTGAADFVDDLERMKNSGMGLRELIEHASYIVSKNNEDFNLPLKGASASHQIYQILLTQWSQYQTGSGMANVPPPESVKSGINIQVDKSGTIGCKNNVPETSLRYIHPVTWHSDEYHLPDRSLTPMATGIAIGAP